MENDLTMDSNPAIIDMYLEALKMQESSGNYQAQHKAEVITDIVTGKKIRVQAIGAYGILDINWTGTKTQKSWAEQAGYKVQIGTIQLHKMQSQNIKYKNILISMVLGRLYLLLGFQVKVMQIN